MVPFVQPCSDTTDLVPRCPVLLEWSRVVSPRMSGLAISALPFLYVCTTVGLGLDLCLVVRRFVSGCGTTRHKSNPNPNPNSNHTTKQHAIVKIQLNSHMSYVSREIHTRQCCSICTNFDCNCHTAAGKLF